MMKPSYYALSKSSGNSKRWLERQSRDPYVRQRVSASQEFRSRSAFKLLEIDKTHPFLSATDKSNLGRPVIVDLGAAPGGWSQVLSLKFFRKNPSLLSSHGVKTNDEASLQESLQVNEDTESAKSARMSPIIIALDLNPIRPIPGVITLQADFLSLAGTRLLLSHIPSDATGERKVDMILSDMAANSTGNSTSDNANSMRITDAVFEFALQHLRQGGRLCMKFFQSPDAQSFARNTLRSAFSSLRIVKPQSSRSESSEAYWLCKGWDGDRQNG